MAMVIRSDHDLPTLRIMADPSRVSSDVVFEVVRGRDQPREAARCSIRAIGLPETLAGVRSLDEQSLQVPDEVMRRLSSEVEALGPSPMEPHRALWLEFPNPRGFLYVVPWERLLAPLGRCMFRLPNHLVRTQAPGQRLEVAICSSAPQAKTAFSPAEMVVRIARQYVEHSGHDVRIHVFTDAASHPEVQAVLAAEPSLGQHVAVHDPQDSAVYQRPPRTSMLSSSPEVSNPWLRWILESMGGRSLDVVHFATHGFLSGERGAIAVTTTPIVNTDATMSRFIGSVEMTAFLTQLGAWGLMLSGPPYNYSDAGLRELADAVALVLPGVALTHDFEHDVDCEQLGTALQTVFGEVLSLEFPLPAATVWVHPRFVDFPDEDQHELHVQADGSSAFIAPATRGALAEEGTEAWVAMTSRCLEQLQVRWLPDSADEEADPAAVAALRNVADLLERHVSRAYPATGTSRGDS